MSAALIGLFFFFFNDTATTEIYTLSLHDALPICACSSSASKNLPERTTRLRTVRYSGKTPRIWTSRSLPLPTGTRSSRSEEHTSELQSPCNLVCRLLLEKKKSAGFRRHARLHAEA